MSGIRFVLLALTAIGCPSIAAPFQETVTLGELRGGDSPELRAQLLPPDVVPLIVEGWVGRPFHAAPGSWGGVWREAATPYGADFCRRRSHRRHLFSLEAGKTTATDATVLDTGTLTSSDDFAFVPSRKATTDRCGERTVYFNSPDDRRATDFDTVRRLAELVGQAGRPEALNFRITCDQKEPVVPCAADARAAFAALDVGRIYSIKYPMAYQTVFEERAASGRMIRLRSATGPENGKWETPTLRMAGADPSASPGLVWQVTLAKTPLGQTEIRLHNYLPAY